MTKLLALIDASVYGRSVCDHAAWAAARLGASVEVLHVLGRRDTSSIPADDTGSLAADARDALLAELAALDAEKARLAQKRGRLILDEAKAHLGAAGIATVASPDDDGMRNDRGRNSRYITTANAASPTSPSALSAQYSTVSVI